MTQKQAFEKAYGESKETPWTETEPPKELMDLIETGKIKPCKVLDVGCGEGLYSIYLASKGFDVTGIDISENAINIAKENAKKANANIEFKTLDALDLDNLNEKFDFIFEWTLLHQIAPSERKKYVENLNKITNNNGKILSVCFNDQDPKITGPGPKVRVVPEDSKGPTGVKLYFSSLDEIKDIFEPYFKIIESKVTETFRGSKNHVVNYLFMEKKK
ncbi:MAG: class I SAM-dependent methyltransferase [archaeon]